MTPEAAEARRKYLKQWRRDHPEACKRYRDSYWQKRAALEAAATQQKGQADDDKQTSTN